MSKCIICNGPSDNHNCMEYLTGRVRELESKINTLFEVAEDGINYVGAANYQSRQNEALSKLYKAMDMEYYD